MTRLRRIEDRDRIFFVTFNLARGVPHLEPNERALVLEVLDALRRPDDFLLFGYVVMPNHVHLLLLARKVSLVRILRDVKSKTGYALLRQRKHRGVIWQRSYFDFICRKTRDFSNKLEYIHQNPVTAGLVRRPDEWAWSSYRHYAGLSQLPIKVDFMDFSGDPDELLWPAPWRRL
jgi:putative transposase